MSGVKKVSFEEEERRRAETMRLAALEAARQDQQRASALLAATVGPGAPQELHALAGRLAQAAIRTTGSEELETIRSRAVALRAATPVLAQVVALVDHLDPARHMHARADALTRLQRATDLTDVTAALRLLRGREPADLQEAKHRHAHRLLEILETCAAAGVRLTQAQEDTLRMLRTYAPTPSLEGAQEVLAAALQVVSPDPLLASLEIRQTLVIQAADWLSAPEWQLRLGEWRPGLPQDIQNAVRRLTGGDWSGWLSVEQEVDAFFWARARLRIDCVLEAARNRGFQASVVLEDSSARTLSAEVRFHGALVALVREEVPSFVSRVSAEATEVRGPDNLNAEQCGALWLGQIRMRAERTGAQATLYAQDRPLWTTQGAAPTPTVGPPHNRRRSSESA